MGGIRKKSVLIFHSRVDVYHYFVQATSSGMQDAPRTTYNW